MTEKPVIFIYIDNLEIPEGIRTPEDFDKIRERIAMEEYGKENEYFITIISIFKYDS